MKTNPSDIAVPGNGSLARAAVRNESQLVVPAIVADTQDDAGERFLEFFAATIRNSNTRTAYLRSVGDFLTWGDIPNLTSLREIRPLHVAAYITAPCRRLYRRVRRAGGRTHSEATPSRP